MPHHHRRRLRSAALAAFSLACLVPLAIWGLLQVGAIVPGEANFRLGPLRLATNCYSNKRFCYPLANANPPPNELIVLVDWPGGDRREYEVTSISIR